MDTAVVGSCPTPDGPVVSGVKAEIAMIPTAESRRPGLVAAALEMAAILDDRRLATTQPSACGRLVAALGELHGLAPTVRGRLKVVTEMSPAKAPS